MDYFNYQISAKADLVEIIMAFLGELPFDTFQETEAGVDAFVPVRLHQASLDEEVEKLASRFDFSYEKVLLKAENWNQVWESNFQPIIVGDFCAIRADFHDQIENVEHEIIINPKMAFGTGHHATTYMVIEQMQNLDFRGLKVLDYGCGTGILAILAARLGAGAIEAVDIELAAFENTVENARINHTDHIRVIHGTLENIETSGFDLVLANINRNVILESLPSLYSKLVKNGKLIVSGFIEKDTQVLLQASKNLGFSPLRTKRKDNWISIVFEKN